MLDSLVRLMFKWHIIMAFSSSDPSLGLSVDCNCANGEGYAIGIINN